MHHVSIALALALSVGVAVVSLSATLPLPHTAEARQPADELARDSCIGYIRLHVSLMSTEQLEQFLQQHRCRMDEDDSER
jgi:hypothetical protein